MSTGNSLLLPGVVVRRMAGCALLVMLAACASQPEPRLSADAPRDEDTLLSGELVGVAPGADAAEVHLLAINDDMRAFLAEQVPTEANRRQKVEAILAALLDDGLKLDYSLFETLTAEEAFYSRKGNCMTFTALFVALARESGVPARFQEIQVPPTWEARGATWLYNKHINAVVDLPGGSMMVDFSLEPLDADYYRHFLEDHEALARYHNNMGVHTMTNGETEAAFLHFRRALQLSPQTGYFWANLGTLYRRVEQYPAAEAAYLRAIDISRDPAAMSNLARLYRNQGDEERAAYYEGKVELFRQRNPYYMYHLANQAYEAGDYTLAVSHARAAIKGDQRHEFYRLLGLAYIGLDKTHRAEEAFERAHSLAEDEQQRASYSRKLEHLAKR